MRFVKKYEGHGPPFNLTPLKKDGIQYIRRMDTCQMLEDISQNLFFLQSLHRNQRRKTIDKYPNSVSHRLLPYDGFAKNGHSFADDCRRKKRKTVIGRNVDFPRRNAYLGGRYFTKTVRLAEGGHYE